MKNIRLVFAALLFLLSGHVAAQVPHARPLYPQGAPDSNGLPEEGVRTTHDAVFMGTQADYMAYPADASRATGQAVVICPGGGYGAVCFDHEGMQVARWLNEQGITAVILRYRMPNGHPDIPIEDALAAIRMVRDKAALWHVDPHEVGVMGFSAGGHLAAAASTRFTGAADRPDFTILAYAAISRDERIIDRETMGNLFGENVPSDPALYSCEKEVTARTPRAFITMSDDDDNVLPGNSICYYEALKAHGIPAELHAYPAGRHGWGWNRSFKYHDELTASLARWLKEIDR